MAVKSMAVSLLLSVTVRGSALSPMIRQLWQQHPATARLAATLLARSSLLHKAVLARPGEQTLQEQSTCTHVRAAWWR